MKKVSLIICLMLVVVFVFSACTEKTDDTSSNTGSSTGSSTASDPASDPTDETLSGTLNFAWWGNPTRAAMTEEVMELFKDANSGVEFEQFFAGFDDYWVQMTTAGLSRDLPDVMQHDYAKLKYWTDIIGAIADLNAYKGDGLDVSNFAESVLAAGTYDGNLYAIPTGTNALAFLYNKSMADAAGAVVTDTWTKAEFFTALNKFATGDIKNPYLLAADPKFWMEAVYVRPAGNNLFSDDEKDFGASKADMTTYLTNAFTDQKNLVGINPVDHDDTLPTDAALDVVVTGKVWGNFYWSNQVTAVYDAAKTNGHTLEIGFVPEANNGGVYLKPAMFWAITRDAIGRDNEKLAVAFVDFLANDVAANGAFKADRGIPCSSVVRDALKANLAEAAAKIYDFIDRAGTMAKPIGPPEPSWASKFTAKFKELYEKVTLEGYAVDQAVTDVLNDAVDYVPAYKPAT